MQFSLSGPNFDIKPSETQKIELSDDKMNSITWVMQPKRTGSHTILIDVSKLSQQGAWEYFSATELLKEGKLVHPIKKAVEAVIEVPIIVNTIWGVSEQMFQLFRSIIALIAFVIATPVLLNFFKSRFSGKPQATE